MFLSLAYGLFIMQLILIVVLLVPTVHCLKQRLINIMSMICGNYHCRLVLSLIVIIAFGLFAENMKTISRYNDIRDDFDEASMSTYKGKHEVLLKLFRAQRNAYLTFGVMFNWLIIYSILNLLITIDQLTARLPSSTSRTSSGKVLE